MTRLRLILFAATALVWLALATPTLAQMAVIDGSNLTQALNQLHQLEQQLGVMQQQYQALAHLPDRVTGMAQSLTSPTLRNPLPPANSLSGVFSGTDLGQLAPSAKDFAAQNRYAPPSGDDPLAQEMRRRSQATSAVQALAQQGLQSIEQRQAALGSFLNEIGSSPDVQQSAAIQSRLHLEQNFISGQQAQATYLQMLQHAQDETNKERDEERHRRDYQGMIDSTHPLSAE